MKIFCDTSVLVRGALKRHPDYERASALLRRVREGEDKGFLAVHTLSETYAVLTGLPVTGRLSPAAAYTLIHENVVRYFALLTLTPADCLRTLHGLSVKSLAGGITYDALLMQTARMAAPERCYTFNSGDFLRLAPDWAEIIREP